MVDLKVYDKASWHIDSGQKEAEVIMRFRKIFQFLAEKGFLSNDGIEVYEFAMDSSVSLNTTMVNEDGAKFLDRYYEDVLKNSSANVEKVLNKLYSRPKAT